MSTAKSTGIIACVILAMLLPGAAAQMAQLQGKTDREMDGLKGAVKRVVDESYDMQTGPSGAERVLRYKVVMDYDRKGYIHTQESFFGSDPLGRVETWQYDPSMRLIGRLERNADGSFPTRYTYEWDEGGHLISESLLADDGLVEQRSCWTWDEAGMLSEMTKYPRFGPASSRVSYLRDARGLVVEERTEWPPGTVMRRVVMGYDLKGNLVLNELWNGEGLLDRVTLAYDSLGRKTRMDFFNADGTAYQRLEYSYDGAGRLVEERLFGADGSLEERTAFAYDALGNKTEAKRFRVSWTDGRSAESPLSLSLHSYEYWD